MSERVTFSFAVPTIFLALFEYLDKAGLNSLGPLQRVVIGGAAPPRAMIQRLQQDMHVQVIQGSVFFFGGGRQLRDLQHCTALHSAACVDPHGKKVL